MRNKFYQTAIWILLLLHATLANSQPQSRAWLVQNGESLALLVGESHIHTELEFDIFFQSVISPAVAYADAGLIELYDFPHAASEWATKCENESPKQFSFSDELLSRMTEYLNTKNPNNEAINLQIAKLRLSFPGFVIDAALNGETKSNLEKYLNRFHKFSFQGVGATIAQNINPNLLFELDGPVTQKNAFCLAEMRFQEKYLSYAIEQATTRSRLMTTTLDLSLYNELQQDAQHALVSALKCIDSATTCSTKNLKFMTHLVPNWGGEPGDSVLSVLINNRNKLWVPKIARLMEDRKRVLIVVGALHLPNLIVHESLEPGLIDLLRKAGYKVTPVTDKESIEPFLRPTS